MFVYQLILLIMYWLALQLRVLCVDVADVHLLSAPLQNNGSRSCPEGPFLSSSSFASMSCGAFATRPVREARVGEIYGFDPSRFWFLRVNSYQTKESRRMSRPGIVTCLGSSRGLAGRNPETGILCQTCQWIP